MEQQTISKTFEYKLNPTTLQIQALERTLMLCRHIYNAAIGERREAWRMWGVNVTYYQQKAELPGIKEALPEYGDVHRDRRRRSSCLQAGEECAAAERQGWVSLAHYTCPSFEHMVYWLHALRPHRQA
jgi:hypothetical protein